MQNAKVKYNHNNTQSLLPPNDFEVEQIILGSMLIDGASIDEVLSKIKSEEVFYAPKHRQIFKAIIDLVDANISIDLITLKNQLEKSDVLEQIGGIEYIIQLTQLVSSTAHIEHHVLILLELWVKRKLIETNRLIVSKSYAKTTDVFDLLQECEQNLDSINEMLETGKSTTNFKDALLQVSKRVELLSMQTDSEIVGITTGFKTLDKFTGGWQPADLVIVAARPGMGKTSFILKNILEIALKGGSVGMFSLEMSIQQITARLVAINSEFHLSQLIKVGFEHKKYFTKLDSVISEMVGLQIFIDDAAGVTIQQLQMKARMWKRKYNIEALFVDYIQLMSHNDSGNREQEIAIISRRLKQLAKELDIPVIALSQLSRAVETRGGDKRPRLSDLRESGAIEQDADTVIFIYRPEYYNIEPEEYLVTSGANTEISFAKYRAGSLATKGLWWQGDKTKFMDVEDKPQLGFVDDDDTPF